MSSDPPPLKPAPPTVPQEQPQLPTRAQLPAHAPTGEPTAEDRTSGMLAHLVGILAGIIGALIMHLAITTKSPFVAHHTTESMNFQITLLIVNVILISVSFVVGFLTMGLALFALIPLFFLIYIGALVLEILACVAAHRGQWHRYPFCIRFIR